MRSYQMKGFFMKNIKDRIYIASFQKDAIETALKYNVGLEVNQTCVSEDLDIQNRSNILKSIKQDFQKANCKHAIVHGPFTEIHPAAIDYRARQLAKERLEEAFQVCQALSINGMIVHSGWLPFVYFKEWQAEKSAEFWQYFMKDKPDNFNIYVENVLEDEPYMMLSMMEQISDSRIKLCLDVGHANAMSKKDIPVEKWIEVLGPHLGHFHLHNNYGTGDNHNDFSNGNLDMDSILGAIDEFCNPNATLTIEAWECEKCMIWLKERNYI
jgi:sugar phosphate isomerase/epimerase